MKEAMLYDKGAAGAVQCHLCAHECSIKPGHRGLCGVRENQSGTLYSLTYGRLVAANLDPVEKKPLFHFLPGSLTFSIASAGCNFRCLHCQNSEISQLPIAAGGPVSSNAWQPSGPEHSPQEIVEAALKCGARSISYTYTEPTVFAEFAHDTAQIARAKGLRNIFVSNGFMTPQSARLMASVLDANNIDLKGDDQFYKKVCKARLAPVQETIRIMKELGVWVEVTTLVIPGHNDSDESLRGIARFLVSIDPHMPWHVSRFHPTYKMTDRPPTPIETLVRARDIGLSEGLKFVYEGNAPGCGGEDTCCPQCGKTLIKRVGFTVESMDMAAGRCPGCGHLAGGIWQ